MLISGFWDRKFGPQTVGPPRTLFQSLKALLMLTQLAFSSGSRNKQVNSRFSIKWNHWAQYFLYSASMFGQDGCIIPPFSPFLCTSISFPSIKAQENNLANIQPSRRHVWSITYILTSTSTDVLFSQHFYHFFLSIISLTLWCPSNHHRDFLQYNMDNTTCHFHVAEKRRKRND